MTKEADKLTLEEKFNIVDEFILKKKYEEYDKAKTILFGLIPVDEEKNLSSINIEILQERAKAYKMLARLTQTQKIPSPGLAIVYYKRSTDYYRAVAEKDYRLDVSDSLYDNLYNQSVCQRLLEEFNEEIKYLTQALQYCKKKEPATIHHKAVFLCDRAEAYKQLATQKNKEKNIELALKDFNSAVVELKKIDEEYRNKPENKKDIHDLMTKAENALHQLAAPLETKIQAHTKVDKLVASGKSPVANRSLQEGLQFLAQFVATAKESKHGQLRPYQIECLAQINAALQAQKFIGYVAMATGTGKTTAFAYLTELIKVPTLIVAPTLLLIEQIKETLEKVNPNLSVGVFDGQNKKIGRNVTITTYPSFYSSFNKEAKKSKKEKCLKLENFDLMIFDEAHGALTKNRASAIQQLTHAARIGFTATPTYNTKRGKNNYRSCDEVFSHKIYSYSIKTAIEQGFLSGYRTAKLEINSKKKLEIKSQKKLPASKNNSTNSQEVQDYNNEEIEGFINCGEVWEALLDMWDYGYDPVTGRQFRNQTAIIFTPTIATAQELEKRLNKRFKKMNSSYAKALHSELTKDKQKDILSAHRAGKIKVVITPLMGAVGYDNPEITLGLDLRPTLSHVLKQQKFGRLLRPDPKMAEKIVNVEKILKKPATERSEQEKNYIKENLDKTSVLWIDLVLSVDQVFVENIIPDIAIPEAGYFPKINEPQQEIVKSICEEKDKPYFATYSLKFSDESEWMRQSAQPAPATAQPRTLDESVYSEGEPQSLSSPEEEKEPQGLSSPEAEEEISSPSSSTTDFDAKPSSDLPPPVLPSQLQALPAAHLAAFGDVRYDDDFSSLLSALPEEKQKKKWGKLSEFSSSQQSTTASSSTSSVSLIPAGTKRTFSTNSLPPLAVHSAVKRPRLNSSLTVPPVRPKISIPSPAYRHSSEGQRTSAASNSLLEPGRLNPNLDSIWQSPSSMWGRSSHGASSGPGIPPKNQGKFL